MACLRTEPGTSSTPTMARGDCHVLRSHGQQGLSGRVGTRQRRLICRTTRPSAKTLLTGSSFRAGADARPDVVAGIVCSADQLSAAQ